MNEINESIDLNEKTDISAKINASPKKSLKLIILCAVALIFGGVLAAIRSMILFGEYDNSICLYPSGTLNSALGLGAVLFGVILAVLAFLLLRGEGTYKIAYDSIGMIFSESLLSLSFAALALSVIVAAKKAEVSLTTFDSVLIALSLVSAVSFFADAFAKKDVLGVDANVVLKLFASVCCLFITFYFYFDRTTAIHNTNKKYATLAFAAALLSILYAAKVYLKKTNKVVFATVNLLCICYTLAYAVPNLVWFFKESEPLLLNVFFDVVALALCIMSGMSLLSFEKVKDVQKNEHKAAEVPTEKEPIEETEKASAEEE